MSGVCFRIIRGTGCWAPEVPPVGLWRMRESALREEEAGGWEPEGPWALLSAFYKCLKRSLKKAYKLKKKKVSPVSFTLLFWKKRFLKRLL